MTEVRGLKIYTKGEITVLVFEDKGYLARQAFIGEAAEHLERTVKQHHSKVVVIDLGGITAVPSDMLGVLVGLQNRGIQIRLFNVTDHVQMILETSNLDKLFDIRDGDLSSLIDVADED